MSTTDKILEILAANNVSPTDELVAALIKLIDELTEESFNEGHGCGANSIAVY